jgi:hypothetical protein
MRAGQSQRETRRFLNENIRALRDLSEQSFLLTAQIRKLAGKLDNYEHPGHQAKPVSGGRGRKIIPFPVQNTLHAPGRIAANTGREIRPPAFPFLVPIPGMPGERLPDPIPDFRFQLQRDGLILLSWDKRHTEAGERYTAYWVTSSGNWRYYASKALDRAHFSFAQPVRKSYAAEDGIEFYGQQQPSYIVHVAPELMMTNRITVDLRPEHIKTLAKLGILKNFEQNYRLTEERKKKRPS